jgi:hypothetical protein
MRFVALLMRVCAAVVALVAFAVACGDSGDDSAGGAGSTAGDDPPAGFFVEGREAVMTGVIDSSTPAEVSDLIDDHPEVTTIVMVDVPGSDDDVANLEASRLIRAAGLATHVPADGQIASGGVDFFLAGATRTYEPGATFSVHSWAAGDGITGADLPQDDPEHDLYLDYYAEMDVSEDFYWFTLEAAPADSFHDMTESELERFGFRS